MSTAETHVANKSKQYQSSCSIYTVQRVSKSFCQRRYVEVYLSHTCCPARSLWIFRSWHLIMNELLLAKLQLLNLGTTLLTVEPAHT